MAALDVNNLPWIEANLDILPLEDIQKGTYLTYTTSVTAINYIPSAVLQTELKLNFAEVIVELVDCPNLTEAPFHLKSPGLGGLPRILEIGGPPYLLPTVDREKVYDLNEICRRVYQLDNPNGTYSAIGAGAGPWPYAKSNCEGIYNLKGNKDNSVSNGGRLVRVDNAEETPIVQLVPDSETRLPLLGNIFLSEGKPGQVSPDTLILLSG